ncbi:MULTISPECIES: HAD-IB family hydrolase [Protofrankia]|uniref:HAD-superfamily subfamily IB hydrolase, TIGR01490 n=1 Tax=Candidatus Protofrankia datiscae TaxID=2716812 RepID=F8B590_9ACTN|nr:MULTISPECIES: HAD-IB family hydrolase [Protofrankia]AEH09948.1 HAD-superfamily subfamily IB hydrolase, TIGR01490 [Candidatus Protofrankia datiscae]
MTAAVDELTEAIRRGPKGPHVGAFFDFDGTLIEGYSARALYARRLRSFEVGPDELLRIALAAVRGPLDEAGFTSLLETGLRGWAGRTEEELLALGRELFASEIAGSLFHSAWRLVRTHVNQGHTVVIATSATRLQVQPMADELGVEHVLCTELEQEGGVVTGHVAGRALWGDGKLAAVTAFAAGHGIDLTVSHAYANGDEDVPFLGAVGYPHPVNPQPVLATEARRREWPALEFTRRHNQLDPLPAVRTAAMFGTLFATAGAGIVAGVLTRDRRYGVDLMTSLFGDVASAVGNIRVDVVGEHNAWSHRPAVFLINHQSTLVDFVVTSRVLRRGFTAVAKAEVRRMPVVGTLFGLAGVAFVDRGSSTKAISALEPAVEMLRSGTSVVIAPEGTRSFTPRVGPFKKGAFHLATAAGVPIVPIVIRNAGEIMWRNARTAREGRIEVAVLPPIPTEGWTRTDIDAAATHVHDLYVDTLDHWPGTANAEPAEDITGSPR